jgi:peptidoglycan hydrolase-like protein with peptidoglycan-binding domain
MKANQRTRTRYLLRRSLTPLTAVALTLGVSAGLTTSASANGTYSGNAYVTGTGRVDSYNHSMDWENEGVVSKLTNPKTNVTCLWQKILWADGDLPASGIDGAFGDNTYNATINWQRAAGGLSADGSAGRNTWGAATYWLYDSNGDGRVDTYLGAAHNFAVSIDSNGRYHFPDDTGTDRLASYNSRTCS